MSARWFRPLLLLTAMLVAGSPVAAQEAPADTAPEGFERLYIRAADRRSDPVLLRDWPELTRLVRWAKGLEAAVASEDDSLSGALVGEFRARLDSLAEAPLPKVLEASRDSVQAVIAAIRSDLDRAEESLTTAPRGVSFAGGVAANAPERQRTLVTGNTAVTVPAGVAVGAPDTLPTAEVGAEPVAPFVEMIDQALSDLDRLVHLTRIAGRPGEGVSSETPAGTERAPSADKGPPRREP